MAPIERTENLKGDEAPVWTTSRWLEINVTILPALFEYTCVASAGLSCDCSADHIRAVANVVRSTKDVVHATGHGDSPPMASQAIAEATPVLQNSCSDESVVIHYTTPITPSLRGDAREFEEKLSCALTDVAQLDAIAWTCIHENGETASRVRIWWRRVFGTTAYLAALLCIARTQHTLIRWRHEDPASFAGSKIWEEASSSLDEAFHWADRGLIIGGFSPDIARDSLTVEAVLGRDFAGTICVKDICSRGGEFAGLGASATAAKVPFGLPVLLLHGLFLCERRKSYHPQDSNSASSDIHYTSTVDRPGAYHQLARRSLPLAETPLLSTLADWMDSHATPGRSVSAAVCGPPTDDSSTLQNPRQEQFDSISDPIHVGITWNSTKMCWERDGARQQGPCLSGSDDFGTPPVDRLVSASVPILSSGTQEWALAVFIEKYLTCEEPVLISRGCSFWPAIEEWNNIPAKLRKIGVRRRVPVEIGSNYTETTWTQEIVSIGEFLDRNFQTRKDDSRSIGYLAQHNIFGHIRELEYEVLVPDEALAGASDETAIIPLAWIGPAGTTTPYHTDPQHNILAQVSGFKFVELIPASQTWQMYPHDSKVLRNTSSITPADVYLNVPSTDRYPEFPRHLAHQSILGPGDLLYIPKGWWHFCRSLTASFSVSYWFTKVGEQ